MKNMKISNKTRMEAFDELSNICLDIANANFEYLELMWKILYEKMGVVAGYSVQKPFVGKDGSRRQRMYHLRIYKKEYVKRFFEELSTTKLYPEKEILLKNWLEKEKRMAII
jgi:hypothetical protein